MHPELKTLPEGQLIRCCARTLVSPVQHLQIVDLLERELDWDYIFKVCSKNFVLPILCWTLLQNYRELVPQPVVARLTNLFFDHTQRNLFLTSKLIEIVKVLEAR